MRPGQNKRMRGRNNNNNNNSGSNNRKGPNPLTRSYESNGPDVKIRGTAFHVAEKYLQLARDAQSSGDPVAAESYLQHAEHYFRLIASAQQAQMGYARQPEDVDNDESDDDDVGAMPDRFASPPERVPAFVPPAPAPAYQERQPYQGERQPYNGERQAYNADRGPAQDRGNGQDRSNQDRGSERSPPERQAQENRGGQDRGNYDRQNRGDRSQRPQRPYRDQEGQQNRSDGRPDYRNREPRQQDAQTSDVRDMPRDGGRVEQPPREQPPRELPPRETNARAEAVPKETTVERQAEPVRAPDTSLPAFITAPVRLMVPPVAAPVSDPAVETEPPFEAGPITDDAGEEAPRFPVRRRRRTRAAIAADLAEAAGRAADLPGSKE